MKTKSPNSSKEIIELNQNYENAAKQLATLLRPKTPKNVLMALDCAPNNGALNPIHYLDGFQPLQIFKNLAASFLGPDQCWIEQLMTENGYLRFKTDFRLGEEIGLWQKIFPNSYPLKVNWNEPFCVKHENGATKIWHPRWRDLIHRQSFATRGEIVKFLYEGGNSYWQPYYLPLPMPNKPEDWGATYRLLFHCPAAKDPELIGGLWLSRRGFKIYPGKGAEMGLISPQTPHAQA
jgi:hypothetical protein